MQCIAQVEMNLCSVSCGVETTEDSYFCSWHHPDSVQRREESEAERLLFKERKEKIDKYIPKMLELLKEGLTHEKMPIDEWEAEVENLIDDVEKDNYVL